MPTPPKDTGRNARFVANEVEDLAAQVLEYLFDLLDQQFLNKRSTEEMALTVKAMKDTSEIRQIATFLMVGDIGSAVAIVERAKTKK